MPWHPTVDIQVESGHLPIPNPVAPFTRLRGPDFLLRQHGRLLGVVRFEKPIPLISPTRKQFSHRESMTWTPPCHYRM